MQTENVIVPPINSKIIKINAKNALPDVLNVHLKILVLLVSILQLPIMMEPVVAQLDNFSIQTTTNANSVGTDVKIVLLQVNVQPVMIAIMLRIILMVHALAN